MPNPNSNPELNRISGRGRGPPTPIASAATAQATTPAKNASAETASQIAAGASARYGAAVRALSSAPNARIASSTATDALHPTRTHSVEAHAPPPNPIRSSQTNTSSAPGGWPDTWVVHESG